MKKIYALLLAFMLAGSLMAQFPQGLNYQAVVRDASGNIIANTQVGMRISILIGSVSGMAICVEEFTPTTNAFGIVTLAIGSVNTNDFKTIDWSTGSYFVKVELDPAGGTSYIGMGISQLISVPYALYANKARTISEDAINGNENVFTGWDKDTLDDFDGTWESLSGKPTFATVATSGLFADLLSKPITLSGYGISDAMSTSHVANGITSTNITNWNTAYSWGNHSGLYKLISYVPSWAEITGKPTFANVAITGSYDDLTNKPILFDGTWTSLTGKPTFADVATSGSYTDLINKPTLFDGTWASLSGKPTFATIATSGLFADLLSKPTTLSGFGISDGMSTSHVANGITSANITNWNTAFGWGNHTTAGYQPLITAGTVSQYWRGDKTWQTLNKSAVGLGNVENIQLSTWTGSANLFTLGTITSGIWNAGAVTTSNTVTANMFIKTGGTSSQFLKADGSVDANNYITTVREVTDEFNATLGQTGFTLTQIPSATSKVKMYINGVRISKTAYSTTNNILTYISSNNGSYVLTAGDRIQFDYSY
jgi:hypothetical protein